MVNLQILAGSAVLAPPVVSRKDFLAQSLVCHRVKSNARTFGPNRTHEAFSVA